MIHLLLMSNNISSISADTSKEILPNFHYVIRKFTLRSYMYAIINQIISASEIVKEIEWNTKNKSLKYAEIINI